MLGCNNGGGGGMFSKVKWLVAPVDRVTETDILCFFAARVGF